MVFDVEGKKVPTEFKKDEEELKNDILYDDVERDGNHNSIHTINN